MIKSVLIGVLVLYLLVLLMAWLFQDKMLFFPRKFSIDHDFQLTQQVQELFLKTPDGEIINCIYATQPGNKKAMLYFHGNGTSLDQWKGIADLIVPHGFNLLMIDYRGYGKSTGRFSEKGFYADAETAYNYLMANGYTDSTIYFYGRSLGSGVAIEMAVRHHVRGLVLESPYTSVKDVAAVHHPYLLPHILLKYNFNSLTKAAGIKTPVLLIHGILDELIPVEQGKQVYQALPGTKKLVLIENGRHNDLSTFDEYHRELAAFLDH